MLERGYRVYNTSQNRHEDLFGNFSTIGVASDVGYFPRHYCTRVSVKITLDDYKPDEVYNLSGPFSVGGSFKFPVKPRDFIFTGTKNLLEGL